MQPKGIEDLAAFSAREKKRAAAEEKKRRVFLFRRTVRVKVGSKVISVSFLKIEERGTLIGEID